MGNNQFAPNKANLWARIFVDELVKSGVNHVCIAPGSRSTPLSIAFSEHPEIKTYVHLDERSASFFALGIGLATGKPAAVVCTSGTAGANMFPAVIEANLSRVPLLIITADRPHELRDSGANQTVDQVHLFSRHVRWFVDIAPPEFQPPTRVLRYLRAVAFRSVGLMTGSLPGPVHINFPFRKPLEPVFIEGDVSQDVETSSNIPQFTLPAISTGSNIPTTQQINGVMGLLKSNSRGIIVCGPRCPKEGFPELINQMADILGFPIFADPLSGVRFGNHRKDAVISGYDTFLTAENIQAIEKPTIILQFGTLPVSKGLNDYLGSCKEAFRIAIWDEREWADDAYLTGNVLWVNPVEFLYKILDFILADNQIPEINKEWFEYFKKLDKLTWDVILSASKEFWFEGQILEDIFTQLPHRSKLFAGNSLPIRHLDQFVSPCDKEVEVFANRGASGIDGVVSSALGIAAVTEAPVILVLGDISFFHDMNGLLAVNKFGLNPIIVLINNNGGGIFRRLPIVNFERSFSELFLTPHGLDFSAVAKLYKIEFTSVNSRPDFDKVFRVAISSRAPHIIEVVTDSELLEKVRQKINREILLNK